MKLFNILFPMIISIRAAIASLIAEASTQNLEFKTCVVNPGGNSSIDDAPAIIDAFTQCGHNGKILFLNETYHVNTVLNTTGLKNCEVDLRGTLLILQSSAWVFGGDNINFQGHGYGTLNGSGQAWYTFIHGKSNYPGRPHAITIANTTNSVFEGIKFVQSQMWTMTVIHSKNVLLQDIYVNNAGNDGTTSSNTDGANTIFSDHITFKRWDITNGDDSIAFKANSTNIRVLDSTFHNGLGIAFGSIGQYKGEFNTIENIRVKNITCYNTLHGAYVKTWTGQQVGYPPNGGGGGLGFMKDILLSDFTLNNLRGIPFSISQCTTFSGVAGACNTSLFEIEDLTFENVAGTIGTNPIASLQCSAAAPCKNITLQNIDLALRNGTAASGYNCDAVFGSIGFNCTGFTCGTSSATGSC
ncbi:Alpha-L-rhamnosidase [Lachnellula hyalina]|uniref:Alpha-L-rhamnosidase n=1 Tax=Lachnellula hyalina TaxID=1316788 RepID=A0A8H8TUX1_9HELO|nr:Alpha-L-rhamnosidase [Lachnellula hyalina]TVY22722.1 Alpha-L-rhamnosidase [Lachnellula hyalina]